MINSSKYYISKIGKQFKVICDYCGREFMLPRWRFEKYKNNFCCADCHKNYFKENHVNRKLHSRKCKYCEKVFRPRTQTHVYCSHKCWSMDYRKHPEIILKDTFAIIKVNYKDVTFDILIDLDDVEKCKKYSWQVVSLRSDFTYFRNCEGTLLHRYIVDCPKEMVVDHINHDTLDNRKNNLRICTFRENVNNRSLINKKSKSGHTFITIKGTKFVVRIKKKLLGSFETLEEALEVRNKYLGELKQDDVNNL